MGMLIRQRGQSRVAGSAGLGASMRLFSALSALIIKKMQFVKRRPGGLSPVIQTHFGNGTISANNTKVFARLRT
jgi:hypothetical protein